jgi:fumarylacetoacetase
VALDDAEARLFGVCLLSDWSARDIQRGNRSRSAVPRKSFAISISPWIVTLGLRGALRTEAPRVGRPGALAVLGSRCDANGGFDIAAKAFLSSQRCATKLPDRLPEPVSRSLLDLCADGDAPHAQRLQSATR